LAGAHAVAVERRDDVGQLIDALREELLQRGGEGLLEFAWRREAGLPDDQLALGRVVDLPLAGRFAAARREERLQIGIEVLTMPRCSRRACASTWVRIQTWCLLD
jgi:hypothetical protein